ncbi:MAG: hypothetical protein H6719_21380 [Sandaracinaceae bacterium]|nr:hypothetical protein [Sandaracinaceae bacterium]
MRWHDTTLALLALSLAVACSNSHGTTDDAGPVGADGGTDAGAGPAHCDGLSPAACFGDPLCAPVFDDACCPSCTDGPCADCTDYTYFGCQPFEGCRSHCGAGPSWGCYPSAPDCSTALPVDEDSCSQPGCVPVTAPAGEPSPMGQCVPITGASCTVACRRAPPACPTGTVPEGDGTCYTDRCIPAFVCQAR